VTMSGRGDNFLSLVHVEDVADLYLLMLEKAKAGTLLNAVAEPFLTQKEVMTAISYALGYGGRVTTKNKIVEQLMMLVGKGSYNIFGSMMRVSSAKAKNLGWRPRSTKILLDDLKGGHYQ
jgi:nucleoside-diphosphate-sugar epimerase